MNRRISKKMEQGSVEHSLNNGIVNNQSNWSRCNSFSSSSSDSTHYCSNSPQRSSFSGRKRLSDEPVAKMVKRSRNSSGSSASSNISCISDKDVNRIPALISPEQVSHEINNIETLTEISPSTLALQHNALLNSRLSHPLDMDAVLPFRHNLRRNIRKKTCSCDCTATCTTVVVSRQYKGIGEQTVEEKTVISRTKVKTFVGGENVQTPMRQVKMSSEVSFEGNLTHKNKCSKKRSSEMERLYDSLPEMSWAEDFSLENILQSKNNVAQEQNKKVQMSSKVLVEENVNHENECNGIPNSNIQTPYPSLNEVKWAKKFSSDKILKPDSNTEQTSIRKVQMSSKLLVEENVTRKNDIKKRRSEMDMLYDSLHEIKWAKNFSPDNILRQFDVRHAASCSAFGKSSGEKSDKSNDKVNKCFNNTNQNNTTPSNTFSKNITKDFNSKNFDNSYSTRSKIRSLRSPEKFKSEDLNPPILEKSILSVEEVTNIVSPHYNTYPILSKEVLTPEKENNGHFSPCCGSIESEIARFSDFPQTMLNLDSDCNLDDPIHNLEDCSATYFNIAENDIDSIDACLRDVGAEVVVSTCCDAGLNNLPLLTAVKEINSSNINSDDCPPLLEPLLQKTESLSFGVCQNKSLDDCSYMSDDKCSQSIESFKKFFPPVDPQLISEENYSVSLCFLEEYNRNYADEDNDEKSCAIENNDENNCTVEDNIDKNYDKVEDSGGKKCIDEENDEKSFSNIYSEAIIDNNWKNSLNSPCLGCLNKKVKLEQNFISDSGPPILESCISDNLCYVNTKSDISIAENINKEDSKNLENTNNFSSGVRDKVKCTTDRINNFPKKPKSVRQICKSIKARLRSKAYIISSGRRILKKYMKFNSKSKRPNKLSKMCNKSLQNYVVSRKVSNSKTFCFKENIRTTENSISVTPLCVTDHAQMPPSVEIISTQIPPSVKIISAKMPPSVEIISAKMPPSVEIISAKMPSSVEIIKSSSFSESSPSQIAETVNKSCISSSESCLQSSETVINTTTSTVIQSFNQKLSFSTSEENITLNEIKNSSILIQSETKPSLNSKKAKKSSLKNIFSNHYSENFADIPGYMKILAAAKKKEGHGEVKVPPRVFTCHYQTINVTRDKDYIQIVLKITRGKSIFLTHQSLVELKEAIIKAGNDKDCRLLILNGFGQTFCLGLDLLPLVGDGKNQAVGEIANAIKDLIGTLADFQKPLVAIVNGAAYGLGLTILNHADVTLATSNASFCMPYSRLGYMPEGGATLTLPQAVGTTVAMDLILRGQVITAEQARDIGLINEVVEVRHLPQDLVSRVQTIAANSLPGMQATKAMVKMRLHIQLPLVLETETKLLPQMWLSPSCQGAIQSALSSGFFENC